MRDGLPSIARRESWRASTDLTRVASLGESAGGNLALQSAFLFSSKIDIKAVICVSTLLGGSGSTKHTVPTPRVILGSRPPRTRQSEALIRDYIRNIEPGAVRSEGDPTKMWPLLLSIVQQAWLPGLLGIKTNARLNLTLLLEEMESIPPLWIIHSKQDSVVS